MNRLLRSLLCLLPLLILSLSIVGCANPPEPSAVPAPANEDGSADAKNVQRIEFAVFGKLKDKMGGFREKRGGGEEPTCTGPDCPTPAITDRRPQLERPTLNPLALAAALSPIALAIPVCLGLGAYLVVRSQQE